jgi:hypothetical protein
MLVGDSSCLEERERFERRKQFLTKNWLQMKVREESKRDVRYCSILFKREGKERRR